LVFDAEDEVLVAEVGGVEGVEANGDGDIVYGFKRDFVGVFGARLCRSGRFHCGLGGCCDCWRSC